MNEGFDIRESKNVYNMCYFYKCVWMTLIADMLRGEFVNSFL